MQKFITVVIRKHVKAPAWVALVVFRTFRFYDSIAIANKTLTSRVESLLRSSRTNYHKSVSVLRNRGFWLICSCGGRPELFDNNYLQTVVN